MVLLIRKEKVNNMTRECNICGTDKEPTRGWIYNKSDLRVAHITDGEVTWEPRENTAAYCSAECVNREERK